MWQLTALSASATSNACVNNVCIKQSDLLAVKAVAALHPSRRDTCEEEPKQLRKSVYACPERQWQKCQFHSPCLLVFIVTAIKVVVISTLVCAIPRYLYQSLYAFVYYGYGSYLFHCVLLSSTAPLVLRRPGYAVLASLLFRLWPSPLPPPHTAPLPFCCRSMYMGP